MCTATDRYWHVPLCVCVRVWGGGGGVPAKATQVCQSVLCVFGGGGGGRLKSLCAKSVGGWNRCPGVVCVAGPKTCEPCKEDRLLHRPVCTHATFADVRVSLWGASLIDAPRPMISWTWEGPPLVLFCVALAGGGVGLVGDGVIHDGKEQLSHVVEGDV